MEKERVREKDKGRRASEAHEWKSGVLVLLNLRFVGFLILACPVRIRV